MRAATARLRALAATRAQLAKVALCWRRRRLRAGVCAWRAAGAARLRARSLTARALAASCLSPRGASGGAAAAAARTRAVPTGASTRGVTRGVPLAPGGDKQLAPHLASAAAARVTLTLALALALTLTLALALPLALTLTRCSRCNGGPRRRPSGG